MLLKRASRCFGCHKFGCFALVIKVCRKVAGSTGANVLSKPTTKIHGVCFAKDKEVWTTSMLQVEEMPSMQKGAAEKFG